MIQDIEVKSAGLTISYFDKEGNINFIQLPLTKEDRFAWDVCADYDKDKDPDFKTWDNKHVKKMSIEYPSKYWLNQYRVHELLVKYKDKVAPAMEEFNTPKKYVVDIEVEVTDGFPDAETAPNKVTTIGITSMNNKSIFVLGLKDLTEQEQIKIEQDINKHFEKFHDKWSFKYIKVEDEVVLLREFFHKLLPKFPCVTGWNFLEYDWKYLSNRVRQLNTFLKPSERIMIENSSPSKKLIGRHKLPQHRLIVDYMEIYKKWDRVIKVKESARLDYVGQASVGVQKVKYSGSIKDLYERDFAQYVFYNAVDCALIYYIDKKLNTMLTFFMLAQIIGVEVNRAFSPIRLMETLMCRKFLEQNKVFVSEKGDESSREFEGAYVKEPLRGFHKWVTCYDFASLYPSTMRQFNISPETFIGNNIEPKEGQVKVGEHHNKDGKMVWRTFDNSYDGILRTLLNEYYAKRKETKKQYLDIKQEVAVLEKALKNK